MARKFVTTEGQNLFKILRLMDVDGEKREADAEG